MQRQCLERFLTVAPYVISPCADQRRGAVPGRACACDGGELPGLRHAAVGQLHGGEPWLLVGCSLHDGWAQASQVALPIMSQQIAGTQMPLSMRGSNPFKTHVKIVNCCLPLQHCGSCAHTRNPVVFLVCSKLTQRGCHRSRWCTLRTARCSRSRWRASNLCAWATATQSTSSSRTCPPMQMVRPHPWQWVVGGGVCWRVSSHRAACPSLQVMRQVCTGATRCRPNLGMWWAPAVRVSRRTSLA